MPTTRRRPADPNLSWPPGGAGRFYRVAVRNEQTGEQRTIYNGTRPSCRLPADYRLSPDQLAFRVESRFADDAEARFRRLFDYAGIDRIGDDFETPAPDLIVVPARDRATAYRLVVRSTKDKDLRFSNFARAKPRFLLPPGRIVGQDAEWMVMARIDDRWTPTKKWRPITQDMIAAAQERAERLIELPREPSPRDVANDAPWLPGRVSLEADRDVGLGRRLLIAVDVTADPMLASAPDPATVVSEQWLSAAGDGLVEHVASTLETAGLSGVFFLDVFAGEALTSNDDTLARLTRRLEQGGHSVELMVRRSPWDALFGRQDATVAQVVQRAVESFRSLVGRAPRLARIAVDDVSAEMLEALAGADVGGVIVRLAEQARLPRWMQRRVQPFAARDDLTLIPVTPLVSTPAHDRDRVVRHAIEGSDALVAGVASDFARTMVTPDFPFAPDEALVTGLIEPLAFLAVRRTVSPVLAEAWNERLRSERPNWLTAGWMRSHDGFAISDGRSEVMLDMVANLTRGLAAGGLTSTDSTLEPRRLARLGDEAWDRVVEHRRGARLMRSSLVRRYDNAYRQALLTEPG